METKTDIWQFQAALSRRLLAWGGLSVGAGAVMTMLPDRMWKGMGAQCAGWGLVDAVIGWLGLRQTHCKAADPAEHSPEGQAAARAALRRVLWINTGLDVGYIAGGVALAAATKRQPGKPQARFWRGSGWGIVIQGGFLLLFDLIHVWALR